MIDLENDAACIDLKDNLRDAKVVTTKWINLYPYGPGSKYYDSEEEAKRAGLNSAAYAKAKTISVEL